MLVLAAGCGGDQAAGSGGGGELAGRTFLSETVTEDGTPVELLEGTRISLEFTADGRLVARASCNILSGDVSIGTDRLETTGLTMTGMGCDPPRHEQDQWLGDFLASSPSWALAGDRLTLAAGPTELVLLDREVADPDRPLAGTRWVVDTLIDGEIASSMVAGTEDTAWLVIEGDTFRASTGCREVEGRVSAGEQQIRFHDAAQTDPVCPPELVGVDETMRAILTAEVEYSIEAGRLLLDHPDGVGLGLHADE